MSEDPINIVILRVDGNDPKLAEKRIVISKTRIIPAFIRELFLPVLLQKMKSGIAFYQN
jgi:hypothetical protein